VTTTITLRPMTDGEFQRLQAAMLALETTVRPLGAQLIDLNVFGDNTVAVLLYERLGYKPTAMNMRKEL